MNKPKSFLQRFQILLTQSALSAALGVGVAYSYALYILPPELLATKKIFTGGYALAGAAAGVVTLRLVIIGRKMIEDYRPGS